VLARDGAGHYSAPVYYPLPSGKTGSGVAVGDFNGDGRDDAAVTMTDPGNGLAVSVVVFEGQPGGSLGPPTEYQTPPLSVLGTPAAITTTVLSPGAPPSLVVNTPPAPFAVVLLNQGDGTFKPVDVVERVHGDVGVGFENVPPHSVLDQFAAGHVHPHEREHPLRSGALDV
jgi:hypothetical protein